jgi:hypothetical protein
MILPSCCIALVRVVFSPVNNELQMYFCTECTLLHFSTLFKIIFYVYPIYRLFRNNEKEQFINRGIKTSNIKKLSVTIILFSILIPLLDCFVFFYIVVGLIPRVKGLYNKTEVSCKIYGISAGVLNLIIISNFQDLIMFSSGIILVDQSQFFIAFNLSVFSAWALLSAHHLFYIYSLNDEILQKLRNPDLFSDYQRGRPFTGDHL